VTLAIFSSEGLPFLFRWIHLLAGITWIGLLYYFNFVQAQFFAETEAAVKTAATQKLVPRALWWFRWAAMVTFLSGLAIIIYKIVVGSPAVMGTSWGASISVGALLGTLMFLNVWFVIWPAQQVVIAKAKGEDVGGKDPVALGNQAFLASRTNTLFSIPMLFFMGAASHLTLFGTPAQPMWLPMAFITLIIAFFEAIIFVGKKGEGMAKLHDSHIAILHAGLALALFFYFVLDLML
jgi:uncharacterized membrane protein